MTDPLNILFDHLGKWLLGYMVEFSGSWVAVADEYVNSWFWAKVISVPCFVLPFYKTE